MRDTRPASSATTTTETVLPGRTRRPELTPVIDTVGPTPSSTATVTGDASTICPFVSTTVASMRSGAPGAALAGTSNENDSVRSPAAGVMVRVAAWRGSPVAARYAICVMPTSSAPRTDTVTTSPLRNVALAAGRS